ncbi:hypothetical protein F1654_09835 [Alkalicaulis satelles]|uniref:Sulfotransferase family protein n=1 Tax=Alkalicaulis satelles TaxID=2609175 RepID=A0A5M6ZH13_9PROT|nr:hypothetical protein [Alkalicaulis satelles]KAA5804066.1 hypothetical protein F1654_09835 [Alkalicaulis satelles]
MALVSYRYGFVFIKTQKTAGTSLEADLSARLEPDAVVTQLFPPVPGHAARNHTRDGVTLKAHAPASDIRAFIGEADFSSFTRFCVEREPVDKCLSHFHMLHLSPDHAEADGGRPESWDAYCEAGRFPVDIAKYAEATPDGWRLQVHHVLAYERLAGDVRALMALLGLSGFQLATRAKSDYRARPVVRREDVTPAQIRRIRAAFAETCALTGLYRD